MLGGYISVDSKRVVLANNIIAILKAKNKNFKSRIFIKEELYSSRTSSRKIIERLRCDKS